MSAWGGQGLGRSDARGAQQDSHSPGNGLQLLIAIASGLLPLPLFQITAETECPSTGSVGCFRSDCELRVGFELRAEGSSLAARVSVRVLGRRGGCEGGRGGTCDSSRVTLVVKSGIGALPPPPPPHHRCQRTGVWNIRNHSRCAFRWIWLPLSVLWCLLCVCLCLSVSVCAGLCLSVHVCLSASVCVGLVADVWAWSARRFLLAQVPLGRRLGLFSSLCGRRVGLVQTPLWPMFGLGQQPLWPTFSACSSAAVADVLGLFRWPTCCAC